MTTPDPPETPLVGRRQRPGDQPLPQASALSEPVAPLALRFVTDGLAARTLLGMERYGQGLLTFNGRDAQRDADEELLDLLQYYIQVRREREILLDWLIELAAWRLGDQSCSGIYTQQVARAVLERYGDRRRP